jgi:hypothetical protein
MHHLHPSEEAIKRYGTLVLVIEFLAVLTGSLIRRDDVPKKDILTRWLVESDG